MNAMPAKYASVTALRDAIVGQGQHGAEYAEKMYHKIPDLPTVKDRARYLVEKAKDKVVLDIGCTGLISAAIRASAKKYYGIDKENSEDGTVAGVDLNHRPDQMPVHEDVELVICSEVLEHLSNPGYFLLALKSHYAGKPVIITVPNAGAYRVREGVEVVNGEHVCWYSYQTLRELLTRYGFTIELARWYNGEPYKAEGIIMVVK